MSTQSREAATHKEKLQALLADFGVECINNELGHQIICRGDQRVTGMTIFNFDKDGKFLSMRGQQED
jgi:hypothetical protein